MPCPHSQPGPALTNRGGLFCREKARPNTKCSGHCRAPHWAFAPVSLAKQRLYSPFSFVLLRASSLGSAMPGASLLCPDTAHPQESLLGELTPPPRPQPGQGRQLAAGLLALWWDTSVKCPSGPCSSHLNQTNSLEHSGCERLCKPVSAPAWGRARQHPGSNARGPWRTRAVAATKPKTLTPPSQSWHKASALTLPPQQPCPAWKS